MDKIEEIRCAIECRDDPGRNTPGRIIGTLLTYGEQTVHDRGPELFDAGALRWHDTGIPVNRMHDKASAFMRVMPEVRGVRVHIDAPLPDNAAGREIAQEIRSGAIRGLSVEFNALQETRREGVRHIQQAVLNGAGLVDKPAYRQSRVEVRRGAIIRIPLLDLV